MKKQYYIGLRKKGGGFISWLIRKLTKSIYSHALLYIEKDTIFEANGFKTADYYNMDNVKLDEYDFFKLEDKLEDIADYDKLDRYFLEIKGSGYDYLDIFVLGCKTTSIFSNWWYKFYKTRKDHMVCSELVDYCLYELLDVDIFEDIIGVVTPADIGNSKRLIKLNEEEKKKLIKK